MTGNTETPEAIFISHASKDKKYVEALVNLLVPLRIPNIVCSSLNGYHIPNDVDIYEYLADKISKTGKVIFVLSENYYNSAACLNEMGACWVLNKNYTTILTPNFNYNNIEGAINPNQMSFKLNDQIRLCEFVESLKDEFKTTGLPTMEFVDLVKQTVEGINEIAFDEKMEKEKLNWQIESSKNSNGKLKIALRIINPTNDKMKVESIAFDFEDVNQRRLVVERDNVDITLRKKENIIFTFDLDYGESQYNMYAEPVKRDVQLRTYIDAW